MSNCNINKIISDKLSVSKLTKTQEIDITIMSDIDSCLKINTRKFEKITEQKMINGIKISGCSSGSVSESC